MQPDTNSVSPSIYLIVRPGAYLCGVLSREGTSSVGAPPSVCVNDDLPSGQTSVSVGPADDKAARGVQMEDGLVVQVLGRDDGLDDVPGGSQSRSEFSTWAMWTIMMRIQYVQRHMGQKCRPSLDSTAKASSCNAVFLQLILSRVVCNMEFLEVGYCTP
jgi:hypothetical protein